MPVNKNHPMFGKHHSEETKKKMRDAKLKNPTRYWLGKKLSPEHNRKLQEGKNNMEFPPNWQGGKNVENGRIRKSSEWKEWRESVFTRDDYTCQCCFEVGGILHPHHIINSAQVIESRFDINNGVTLCRECHTDFHHIYGTRSNTLEQIVEFIEEEI